MKKQLAVLLLVLTSLITFAQEGNVGKINYYFNNNSVLLSYRNVSHPYFPGISNDDLSYIDLDDTTSISKFQSDIVSVCNTSEVEFISIKLGGESFQKKAFTINTNKYTLSSGGLEGYIFISNKGKTTYINSKTAIKLVYKLEEFKKQMIK